jgi:hypothetical protein
MRSFAAALVAASLSLGCGTNGSSKNTCDPAATTPCSGGLVCEQVSGGTPGCFSPLQVEGRTFDLANANTSTNGVAGARVVALDANRAPLSAVGISGADGSYGLQVPWTRLADGTPVAGKLTLRADASGYQTFPSGTRVALPIDVSAAVKGASSWTLRTAQTDVGLQALSTTGLGQITGTVAAPPVKEAVLVVAVPASGHAVSVLAGQDGAFTIFNVPGSASPGASYTVEAYAAGANYNAVSPVMVVSAQTTSGVSLTLKNTSAQTVTGTVGFVGQNLPATPTSSVILVVDSTYDSSLGVGEPVTGLRAQVSSTATGFTISGVPDGTYVVLGAFENDFLVRDTGGGSAPPPVITVAGAPYDLTSSPIKITGAVTLEAPFPALPAPFADVAPVTVSAGATPSPSFAWTAYPAGLAYDAAIVDEFGATVWSQVGIAGTIHDVTPALGALAKPGYYQFRVKAYQNSTGGPVLASQSEDLMGVFYLVP